MAVEDDEVDNGANPGSVLALGVIFLPAGVTAFLFYCLLRFGRLRLSSVFQVLVVFEVFIAALWALMGAGSKAMAAIKDIGDIGSNWANLLTPLILFYAGLGGVIGFFIVWWEIRQMKSNPHRLELKGNWQYKFQFRRTISQVLRRRRRIEALKNGVFIDTDKASMGLNEEEDDRPVARYYAEAQTHTMISGASGSGKALHEDTLIPTPYGMSTVGSLREGDVIFDENGEHTKIVGKFQPMTEDHYRIVFSDGTSVLACGDHQWTVELRGSRGYPSERISKQHNLMSPSQIQIVSDLLESAGFAHSYSFKDLANNFVTSESQLRRALRKAPRLSGFKYPGQATLERLLLAQREIEENNSRSSKTHLIETLSTRSIFSQMEEHANGGTLFSVDTVSAPALYSHRDLAIDPYTLGAWLGDGVSRDGTICGSDEEVALRIAQNETIASTKQDFRGSQPMFLWRVEGLHSRLRNAGLLQRTTAEGSQKDIPDEYVYSSESQRLALLSGLLDTDGSCSKTGSVSLTMTNRTVVEKAREVACSLGLNPSKIYATVPPRKLGDPNTSPYKTAFSFQFFTDRQLFEVRRKAERVELRLESGGITSANKRRYITSVEPIEDHAEAYYCFTVDSPSHLFLCTESYIPTHNTITMLNLIRADMQNQVPTVVLDFKRSPEMAAKVAAWAEEFECEFYHFVNGNLADYDIPHSKGPARYDPLGGGSPTAKADMVLGMREYDTASAVYKSNMQQLLQVLFSMLHYADRKKAPSIRWSAGGVYQLASAVAKDNFSELAIACEGTPIQVEAEEVMEQLRGKTGLRHALEELQGQIRTIIASEYGQWMKTSDDERGVDIFELTQKPGSVILFSLNSDSEPEFAKYVGSMILADITNTSAKRRNQQLKNQVQVYVDEFQAVNPSAVTGLLEKSRESRMAVTLAQQSFEQVIKSAPANGEAYLLSILDTCSNFIVHNGMTEDSAERLSKILGKHSVTRYRSTNNNQSFFLSVNWKNKRDSIVTTAEEEEWVFPPRKFMTLMSPVDANGFKSTAVVINKACSDPEYAGREGAVARRIWVVPAKEVLENYYEHGYRLDTSERSSISVVHDDGDAVELMKTSDLEYVKGVATAKPWETIVPQDYDFIAERRAQREAKEEPQASSVLVAPEEDADGGFGFESIDDDLDSLATYREDLSTREEQVSMPLPKPDVLDQWASGAAPPPRRNTLPSVKEPVKLPKPPVSKDSALPSLPGLPVAPKNAKTPPEEPEEITLPSL